MSLTLNEFATKCRTALKANPGAAGVSMAASLLAEALKDKDFVNSCVNEQTPERHVIYEDDELGFCIVAHGYSGQKTAPPHDHENTWAIYGQASGETEMFDYEIIEKGSLDQPGKARVIKSYTLKPGMAHAYQVGVLHSPKRNGPTQLIRIEGKNLVGVKRVAFDVVE